MANDTALPQSGPHISPKPATTSRSRAGSHRVMVLDRSGVSYPVSRGELDDFSGANTDATFWWSVASFWASSAFTLYTSRFSISAEALARDPLTMVTFTLAPILIATFAFLSLVYAATRIRKKNALMTRITGECGDAARPPIMQRYSLQRLPASSE